MSSMLFLALLAACALVTAAPGYEERLRHHVAVIGGLLVAVSGVLLAWPVVSGMSGSVAVDGLLRLDRVAAFVLLLVMSVYAAVVVASRSYLMHERASGAITERQVRLYYGLLHLFVLMMTVTVLANHIVVLWIALEATTLSTTLLVAFRRTTGSVEAAWKYIVLCSTGITIGLLGVLMMMYAGQSTGVLPGESAFLLSALRDHATGLSPAAMRWAFAFLMIGIGTKVGFVPMHPWLPDAHSKAPSPISALFSGVLLNVALIVLLRCKLITDLALGSSQWTNRFFLTFGILSIAVPAFVLLSQQNYKRMLGYSSIEHMGIIAFAVGLGPFGMVPAVMHMAGHALAKPLLFLGAGEFLHVWKTTTIAEVRGAFSRMPKTATLFLLGLLGLLAVPPSALFVSELFMVGYGIVEHPVLTAIVLVLLTIACIALLRIGVAMLFGKPSALPDDAAHVSERGSLIHLVLGAELVGLLGLGCWFMTQSGFLFAARIANDLVARV